MEDRPMTSAAANRDKIDPPTTPGQAGQVGQKHPCPPSTETPAEPQAGQVGQEGAPLKGGSPLCPGPLSRRPAQVAQHIATLTTLATEFEGLVTALTEQARMAERNRGHAGMTPAMDRVNTATAERFSGEARHFEARAKACRAGIDALTGVPA